MKKLFLLFSVLMCLSFSSHALNIAIGGSVGTDSIWVYSGDGTDDIAIVEDEFDYYPFVSLKTDSNYFGEKSGWGYDLELSGSVFDLNKQSVSGNSVSLGTGIRGVSVYLIPHLYYHFNRFTDNGWSSKVGIGVGVGYLNLKGTFQVTDPNNPKYNDIESVNTKGLGNAGGLFIEISKGKHSVLMENYAPDIDDERYSYMHSDYSISYRYVISIF